MVKSDSSPMDNEANIFIITNTTPVPTTAFFLLIPFESIKYATTTSSNDIDEVSAARANAEKNITENTGPNDPISANIAGTTANTSPAPSVGSMPNANSAGKIAIAANNAIFVSSKVTIPAEFGIFPLLGI